MVGQFLKTPQAPLVVQGKHIQQCDFYPPPNYDLCNFIYLFSSSVSPMKEQAESEIEKYCPILVVNDRSVVLNFCVTVLGPAFSKTFWCEHLFSQITLKIYPYHLIIPSFAGAQGCEPDG